MAKQSLPKKKKGEGEKEGERLERERRRKGRKNITLEKGRKKIVCKPVNLNVIALGRTMFSLILFSLTRLE